MSHFYDFAMTNHLGETIDFHRFEDKVVLIVNTATHCGFTSQYEGLESLYETYQSQGFTILDFPCNQFRNQAPEPIEEIVSTCRNKYGVSFPVFQKIKVNGPHEAPLYTFLKSHQPSDEGEKFISKIILKMASIGQSLKSNDIQWNFTKFLVNKKGEVTHRFSPNVKPQEIAKTIENLLSSQDH